MSIDKWRTRIDEIDQKLLELLAERARCAIEIGKIKRMQNLGFSDPERERQIIENIQRGNRGPLDDEGLKRLFERIIDECHRIERRASTKE